MLRYLLLVSIFLFSTFSFAQKNQYDLIYANSKHIIKNENNQFIFYITLEKKQTIYSLSKLYQCTTEDIYMLNGLTKDHIFQIGEQLIVPFSLNMISFDSIDPADQSRINFIYKVQPKETLYKISRNYFRQDMGQLMQRNNFSNFSLEIGQEIHIGSMKNGRIPPLINPNVITHQNKDDQSSDAPVFNKIISSNDTDIVVDSFAIIQKDSIDKYKNLDFLRTKKTKVLGYWNKSEKNSEEMFVLHNTARVNSIVEIFYPLSSRKVFAKVAGKINHNLTPKSVQLIMSSRVAKSLGVIDSRASLELNFQSY